MTGIGINLREVPDDNGVMKIKVLGLLLDGPAHLAGVRQVQPTTDLILEPVHFNAFRKTFDCYASAKFDQ